MARPRRAPRRVVGRRDERAALRRFLRRPEGLRALVITGEPGIGKTTLWLEAVAAARRDGDRVHAARPAEPEARATYAVLGDLLDDEQSRAAIAALPEHQRDALDAAVTGATTVTAAAWQLVGMGLLGVLRAAIEAGRPVVVAIDDIQWADRPSVRVLEFALRRLTDRPVLVLATRRLAIRRASTAAAEALASLEPVTMPLGPLPVNELQTLLEDRDIAARSSSADRLHAAAAGNPFIALEMVRAMPADQKLVREPPPVGRPALSARLRQLSRAHVAALDDDGLRVVLVAAAMSRPSINLIERAVGDSGAVLAGLANAESAGVLELDRGEVSFSHPLLAAAVYEGASNADRRSLHRRLADIVPDIEERAWHHALAAQGHDEEAAAALTTAAQQALARPAPDSALALLTEALALTDPADATAWGNRSVERGRLLLLLDRPREALEVAEAVAARATAQPTRARALELAAEAAINVTGPAQSLRFAEQALALTSDSADAARIGERIGDLLWSVGRQAELAGRWRWNVRQAEASGDEGLVIRAKVSATADAFIRGQRSGPSALRSMQRAARSFAGRPFDLRVHLMVAQVAQWADDPITAQGEWGAVVASTLRLGNEMRRLEIQGYRADLWFRTGDWDVAFATASEGASDVVQLEAPIIAAQAHAELALVAAARGSVEASRAYSDRGLELARDYSWLHARNFAARGFLSLAMGDEASAREQLNAAAAADPGLLLRRHGACWISVDRIEAQAMAGAVAEARDSLAQLESQASAWGDGWIRAAALRSRAHVLAAEASPDEACEAADEAVERYARLPYPFELARALLLAGTLHRRLRHRQKARRALVRAQVAFSDLGSTLWLARTNAELARVGGRAPSQDRLTGSELAVANLVARGFSNPEVARELVLTARTVESHLTQIYAKLGLRSRTELARALLTGVVPSDEISVDSPDEVSPRPI